MIEVNYLAVLLAAVAFMVVGFLWYSPILFAKRWMKLKGYTAESMKESQKEMGKLYIVSFLLALVTAYVLSHVIGLSMNTYDYSDMMTGVTSAFWMWLGFVMPTQATATIFSQNRKWELFALDTGYQLVGMIVMGIVLALV